MSYDVKIEDDVRGALALDRRLTSPDEVAVSSVDGTVVLRGTVGSFSQRYAAVRDAVTSRASTTSMIIYTFTSSTRIVAPTPTSGVLRSRPCIGTLKCPRT